MTNKIHFAPERGEKANTSPDDLYKIPTGLTNHAMNKWRLEEIKKIVRSKPSGHLFRNIDFRERLGYDNDNGFYTLKKSKGFENMFVITPKPGDRWRYEIAVKDDTTRRFTRIPEYPNPYREKEKNMPDETPTPVEAPKEASAPVEAPVSSKQEHDLLALAKAVAVERLARSLTVGEVLDGAKEYGLQ